MPDIEVRSSLRRTARIPGPAAERGNAGSRAGVPAGRSRSGGCWVFLAQMTVTVPQIGSTSTSAPCGIRVVASWAPVTALQPNSRATIAA